MVNVLYFQMNKNVQCMDLSILNSNVNSAARLPNGFAGETLIFVIAATRKCVLIRIFISILMNISFRNAKDLKIVQ